MCHFLLHSCYCIAFFRGVYILQISRKFAPAKINLCTGWAIIRDHHNDKFCSQFIYTVKKTTYSTVLTQNAPTLWPTSGGVYCSCLGEPTHHSKQVIWILVNYSQYTYNVYVHTYVYTHACTCTLYILCVQYMYVCTVCVLCAEAIG